MTKQVHPVTRIFKKAWIAFAIFIIFAAVTSSLFRSLTPWAVRYKGDVEHEISLLIGQPVTIQTMETGWYWFEPILRLDHVTIYQDKQTPLRLGKLLIGINLFKSLWYWRVQPGVLYVEDIHLNIRQTDGRWIIDGIASQDFKNNEFSETQFKNLLSWLTSQQRLVLKKVSAHFYFSDGNLIPVKDLNLNIVNHDGRYKFKGNASLEQTNHTTFELIGDVTLDVNNFSQTKGQIYFSSQNIIPAQWQDLVPWINQKIKGGKASVSMWIDLKKGSVSQVQSQVRVKRLAWSPKNSAKQHLVQSFSANLLWKPESDGWLFDADQVKLRMGGIFWPQNRLALHFNPQTHSYKFYIKSLDLETFFSNKFDMPVTLTKLRSMKPRGLLTETQIVFSPEGMSYFLTRFDQLGFNQTPDVPGVDHLTGVLSWQPDQGKLELDSQNVGIHVKGYPDQKVEVLNGAIDWKELANGRRLSIERFVVSQPELTVTSEGTLDNLTATSVDHVRLHVDFSGKNLQKWLPYLPVKSIKPKLLNWLQHDIKEVKEGTGTLELNGYMKDFPFDDNNGEFSIAAHVSGGSLLINPKWMPVSNIEAYVRLKNRNLEFDFVNGEINTVPFKQAHLRIDNIGRNRETLLLHAIAEAPVQKMIEFTLKSPLKKRLSRLEMISMNGNGLLDLRLEVPLYPQKDDVTVLGELSLQNNRLSVKQMGAEFRAEDLQGDLYFDEHGMLESTLNGNSLGYPIKVSVDREQKPKSTTQIIVDTQTSVQTLKSKFQWQGWSYFQGAFPVQAILKLTDDPNDLDSLTLNSDLKGLTIKLPKPLSKAVNDKTPSSLTLHFNASNQIRMSGYYGESLSSDLLFEPEKSGLVFKSGQLNLGSAHAAKHAHPGLDIVGSLVGFDLDEWSKFLKSFKTKNSSSDFLHYLHQINVTLGQFRALNQNFDQLSIKAKMLTENEWALTLQQKNIQADITYDVFKNVLAGHFQRLVLPGKSLKSLTPDPNANAHPGEIPKLNIRIDDLRWGDIELGGLTLKSHSEPDRLTIDYCRLDSPAYEINLIGDWVQKANKNTTQIQMQMRINSLAESLKLWQISPAVDAGKGEMDFVGGWDRSLYDFSLSQLKGVMHLKLKKGIITHLSPETEEKLGLGKLLSILSLQTIPRRLTLDFSDLSHDGFSFDIFKGTFDINRGIMSTQDSYLDGPVAYAGMKGDLDLAQRRYDLNLRISPHITASLPVVATIAGGPVAGIAAWVASKIINQGIQTISAYTYKVTGPWDQPVVQQVSIVKKRH